MTQFVSVTAIVELHGQWGSVVGPGAKVFNIDVAEVCPPPPHEA
jgi:hypothetical protein